MSFDKRMIEAKKLNDFGKIMNKFINESQCSIIILHCHNMAMLFAKNDDVKLKSMNYYYISI